jgi:YjbE family integral membrane protein
VDFDTALNVLKIALIDLALAGDNALVIALAVRTLPPRQQFYGRMWGTVGAVGLRLAFITIVTYLLAIPLLQLIGGVLLVWIAIKLVRQVEGEGEAAGRTGTSLPEAIWIVIVADAVMSLDNVIGIAGAAEGNLWLVVFGIGLSIPIVVWGSGVLAVLMSRYPWVVLVAAGILGEVAGKMIVHDHFLVAYFGETLSHIEMPLRLALAGGIVVIGWIVARRKGALAHLPPERRAAARE